MDPIMYGFLNSWLPCLKRNTDTQTEICSTSLFVNVILEKDYFLILTESQRNILKATM